MKLKERWAQDQKSVTDLEIKTAEEAYVLGFTHGFDKCKEKAASLLTAYQPNNPVNDKIIRLGETE